MVWPFSSGNDTKSTSSSDPYKDLDPSLRKFLEKESPLKYQAPEPKPPAPQPAKEVPIEAQPPKDPSYNQSLFSDGRYSHLWKTYRPQAAIDDEHKSDQERLMDILNAYKDRRASIGRAALENCALSQWELNECFRKPSMEQRMVMCRNETKRLDRCYTMNARFLKALGYLSSWDRPPEVEEAIQMHADKLYTTMLEREQQIETAKKAGLPEPNFPPLFGRDSTAVARSAGSDAALDSARATSDARVSQRPPELDQLTPEAVARFEERLKGMTPLEREVEERAYAAEIASGVRTLNQLDQQREDRLANKQKRKERGEQTIGDRVTSLFGW